MLLLYNINNDILYEILKFKNAKELDQLKLINSKFNQIICQYFNSKPLNIIKYFNAYSKDNHITKATFQRLKSPKNRIKIFMIFLNLMIDDFLNLIIENKHLWNKSGLCLYIKSEISLEYFLKIFQKIFFFFDYITFDLNDKINQPKIDWLPEFSLIDYLNNNYGKEYYFPFTLFSKTSNCLKFINELREVTFIF